MIITFSLVKHSLCFLLLLGMAVLFLDDSFRAQASSDSPVVVTSAPVDPNRSSSEFNHHVAGYALIGVGLLVLGAQMSSQLRPLRWVWPGLFVLAGMFLAAWSDAEMWPRGNLSWAWLIHHDTESLQHKIYALLLVALGVIEYLRARKNLNSFWRTAAFPLLAALGAGLLLFHDHGGGPMRTSAEFVPYLVNPALDQDGRPWSDNPSAGPVAHVSGMADCTQCPEHAMVMTQDSMTMEDSAMKMPEPAHSSNTAHHHFTSSMLLIGREHFWFMIVGFGIALFKLLSDMGPQNRRFIHFLWPSTIIVLGVLLTFYRE